MSEKIARKTRRTSPLMAVAVHCLVRDLHSEAAENGITITPTETMDDKCPDCGGDTCPLFQVEEWARTYCDECLERELLKYLPNANVDLPDTAAQDSASKSNNPAVSG